MVIPQWLSCYLKSTDLDLIEDAIVQAEKKTSAEIIPVIVKSSSPYYQTRVTLVLIGFILFLITYELFELQPHWDSFNTTLIFVVSSLFLIFGILPRFARIGLVQRWMTIYEDEKEQVAKRAQIEFYQNSLTHTQDKVGVLIFISLLEHQVVVLTDKAIAERFPPETWQNAVGQILAGIKRKQMAAGLKEAIATLSGLLAGPFPIKSDDKNELPDKIIIKE